MLLGTKDLICKLADKAARQCGVEIYTTAVQLQKKSVKISVRIDNGAVVSHDDCAQYSQALAALLDEESELPDYELEISSPGLKRELRTVAECIRFIDAPVKVVYPEGDAFKTVKGILRSVDGSELTVESGKKRIPVTFDALKKAQLDY